MPIPTEPIGSIPRPLRWIEAVASTDGTDPGLDPLYEEAIRDTIPPRTRDTAFAKIRARVVGTALAAGKPGIG
jgi:hypothetical protein